MNTVDEMNPSEAERFTTLVQTMQEECARLRQALATMEEERNLYLKALYAKARERREFENLDIPSLEAISAGPVELIH